jgi:hypothetical protein
MSAFPSSDSGPASLSRAAVSRRFLCFPSPDPQTDLHGLPNFLVVGPPRTATTWLHDVMKAHANLPRIVKEPRFFDLRYAKGLDWYRKQFEPIAAGTPIGEMGATYFYSANARRRIASVIPHAKIICILRDPVARLYSLYSIRCASGTIRSSFRDALQRDRELIESSRYYFHLTGWIDTFGREQVLVLTYDQLVSDAQAFVDQICRFIGIAPFTIDPSLRKSKNASTDMRSPTLGRLSDVAVRVGAALNTNDCRRTLKLVRKLRINRWFLRDVPFTLPPLDAAFAEELRVRMLPEINALEGLLNTDLSSWKPRGH